MLTSQTTSTSNRTDGGIPWIKRPANVPAVLIAIAGFLTRAWAAHGIFLNPDEALHFRLANQPSLALAYKESLTASHPPMLTAVLYYWRALGTSDLWLRMPSVLAGGVFCWMFYCWLRRAAGPLAGLIGLIFVSLLPPIVLLGAEIRQYSFLLAFLACALFFLDGAFDKNSANWMAAFSLSLYLAMLSHYSAFLFAAAIGVYALIRFFYERKSVGLIAAWAAGQVGALAVAFALYRTHIAKLGVGESRTAMQGWMSEFFLRRSYFDPAHDNRFTFLIGHTFGVFQYFFGQLAVGDATGLLFFAGVALLLRRSTWHEDQTSSCLRSSYPLSRARLLGLFSLLPFLVGAAASMGHTYPYGGTRHMAFLLMPAIAGVSVAIARIAAVGGTTGRRCGWGLGSAAAILLLCVVFGKTRPPKMERRDQSREQMTLAIGFIENKVGPDDIIFTDYQTDLILGHYLCAQKIISFERSPANYEQFFCAGRRVVSMNYKEWQFWAENFVPDWQNFVQAYGLKVGTTVWIVQSGWMVDLPEDLLRRYAEFRDLKFQSFGDNVKIFRITVGSALPAIAR